MDTITKLFESTVFGNILNLIGILISIVGFAITIRTALKSRTAAQAAQESVQKVREDIKRVNAVVEFATALATLEEIRRLHRAAAWHTLLERYANLKTLLVSIRTANADMPDPYKTSIQGALTQLSQMETQVERFVMSQQNMPDALKFNMVVSKQIDSLREILVEIQNSIGA